MTESQLTSAVGIVCGIFSMFCAYMDFDFFMENHKARFFVNTFGRNGARIFYGVLGLILFLIGLGVLFL